MGHNVAVIRWCLVVVCFTLMAVIPDWYTRDPTFGSYLYMLGLFQGVRDPEEL